jgi:HNH endonuclease
MTDESFDEDRKGEMFKRLRPEMESQVAQWPQDQKKRWFALFRGIEHALGGQPTGADTALGSFPFHCLNCFATFENPEQFCSKLCQDEASWVRYVRRQHKDGGDQDPEVPRAIKIKLALILGGGYNRAARRLSEKLRQMIIERDGGVCRICGEPANEIDHISGSSSDPANLQLLCDRCHNKKTEGGFRSITKDSHPVEWVTAKWLRFRAAADKPLLVCDYDAWDSQWRNLKRTRLDALTR